MRFKLRFLPQRVAEWADKYDYPTADTRPFEIGKAAKARGYMDRDEFLELARWKTPRSRPQCQRNDADFVREVTAVALTTSNERMAIEVLTLLHGVSWPTASVILHFCSRHRYPILDFRALWTLSCKAQPAEYDFPLWRDYVQITRELADAMKIDMRTLDRALWAYSKANQPAGT